MAIILFDEQKETGVRFPKNGRKILPLQKSLEIKAILDSPEKIYCAGIAAARGRFGQLQSWHSDAAAELAGSDTARNTIKNYEEN